VYLFEATGLPTRPGGMRGLRRPLSIGQRPATSGYQWRRTSVATMEQGNLAKGQKWGRPHSHPGLCLGRYEVLALSSRVANAASRRREGRLRPPVVNNAEHRSKYTVCVRDEGALFLAGFHIRLPGRVIRMERDVAVFEALRDRRSTFKSKNFSVIHLNQSQSDFWSCLEIVERLRVTGDSSRTL